MPTPTYTPLANITLGSTAATVTFSSIPATYRDLVVIQTGGSSAANDIGLRFNGNTSSVYSTVGMFGNGSTASSNTTSTTFMRIYQFQAFAGTTEPNAIISIFDYAQTNKHKSVLTRSNFAPSGGGTSAIAGRFADTSAITSFSVTAITGVFVVGSTFALYGIIS
jgi:hypothetical protein